MHKYPYKRNIRQFKEVGYQSDFILHSDYANSPRHYIRAFLLLQKDILNLFDYIEPADLNLPTFSFRIHELLVRTCIEIEANLKAILIENGYKKLNKKGKILDYKIVDYKKINATHRLSSYEIKIPNWIGVKGIRRPFKDWLDCDTLRWYKAYNATKHDRHREFNEANFENLIDSVCGLVALLSSQFHTNDLSPEAIFTGYNGINDEFETAIGGYFRVKFPTDWPEEDRYDFNWNQMEDKIIHQYDYNQ